MKIFFSVSAFLFLSITGVAAEFTGYINNSADDKKSGSKITLFDAVRNQDARQVEIMLRNNARPNQPNQLGEIPLHVAAALGNQQIADILILYGSDVDARNNFGDTPLHYGSRFPEIVDFLLKEWDADDTLVNQENCTYLQWDDYAERIKAKNGSDNG
jgi:hypothetical protein